MAVNRTGNLTRSTKVFWERKRTKKNLIFGKGNSFEIGWKPAIIDLFLSPILNFLNKGVDTK